MWRGLAGIFSGLFGLVFAIWRYPDAVAAIGQFVTNVEGDLVQTNPAMAASLMVVILIFVIALFAIYIGVGFVMSQILHRIFAKQESFFATGVVVSTVIFLLSASLFVLIIGTETVGGVIAISAGVTAFLGLPMSWPEK